ncbi:MAG: glutathione S-transferase [Gammaproteobacteria bacterium]|jgi:glutathione S-transferase
MIKLHGVPVSNYYNMVKLAMLEKGIEFEEVTNPASQETNYKKMSPMGKMPFIETKHGCLSETNVILDYLEATNPSKPLYPADPFEKAKVQEIMRVVELYIELAGRRHFGHVFFKGPKSDAAVEEVRPVIENGLGALKQLCSFGPYLCGEKFTYADIVAHNSFGYCNMATQAIYGWDIVAAVPGLGDALAKTAARDTTKKVDLDLAAAMQAFMAAQG